MPKRTKWKIAVAVFAVMLAGAVYCIFFTDEKTDTVIYQSDTTDDTQIDIDSFMPISKDDESEEKTDLIYVHICGAVANPGVYSLARNSRVCDVIALAGGLTEQAADDYVNQARFLNDGERVYIPEIDELSMLSPAQYVAGQTDDGQNGSREQKTVNINTAGVSELTTLPGIGESRAESIIAYREQHGSFARTEDIMRISGIKDAAYEKIKDRICTGNE